jgi:thiol-disulfide isomerase/thioredoxin
MSSSLGLGAVAIASGCSSPPARAKAPKLTDPKPLPAVTLASLDGAPKSLAEIVRGKVAVIDLWASWCTACRPVSARVAILAEAHAGDADLVVLGVNEGEERAAVVELLKDKRPPHETYVDPGFTLADALGARELPGVVVVDRTGQVISLTRKLDAPVLRLVEDELASPAR